MEFLILGVLVLGGFFYFTHSMGWNNDGSMREKDELLSEIYRANNPIERIDLKETDQLFWQDDRTSAYYRESSIVVFHINEDCLILREISQVRNIKQAEADLLKKLKQTEYICYYDNSSQGSVDFKKGLKYRRVSKAEEARQAPIKEALNKAKYAFVNHPKYGTVTWTGKGRKPKWIVEYLAEGRDLSEIEYPPKKITNSENFIIEINQDLSLSKGPHGSFAHHKFKDVKGDLWFDPDRTLYDFDGVAIVPMEVIDELKRQGFNMSYAEDDHIDTDV